jgi:tetratricopeptide (TPR) repeat protein
MDSKTVLARFESERQALALMDHPNIARVLDAGATDAGRPFFVMELVKGIPLTDYCDQHRLGLPERLTLFRQICSAVQHAHQKGIIHRDLKPSNILVESHDGQAVPKVIDFGLAKATSGLQLSEHSLFTAFGTVAGTPLYMAPEQASFNALDIDTRADIYALGVILYELLTGSTPIQRETFKQAALDEILRVIREVEPPTPSSRISTSEALPAIAATRQTEPARLGRFVQGDLDWIVMKALAKERQRRYESAIALAQDLERFTSHEPVSAGPPTASYRLRKFVRRNRPQVVAAALALVALVAGIVGTTLGLVEARRQERIALTESNEKEKARQAEALQRRTAEEQRRQAEKRLTQVEKANEILGSIFKDLDPRNEEQADKPIKAQLGERLDQAIAQIKGDAIGDALTVARMQMTLGSSLLGLGYAEKAIVLFTEARGTFTAKLGPDHPDTLNCMDALASACSQAGKYDHVLSLREETLALRKSKLGADHPDTLKSMLNLASFYDNTLGKHDRALPLREEILAGTKARYGPDHPETLVALHNLAVSYRDNDKLDRVLPLFEELLALEKARLGPDHPQTLATMNRVAAMYEQSGKLDRASPLFEEVRAHDKTRLGADHRETQESIDWLADSYRRVGKPDRALQLYEEGLALSQSKLGPDHPQTLQRMSALALAYERTKKYDRAVQLREELLARQRARFGPDHPDTLGTMSTLAVDYRYAGQPERALPLHKEVRDRTMAKLGPDHPQTLTTMNNLARGYQAVGKLDLALPLFEETLALQKAKLGPDHPSTLQIMDNLAVAYRDAGKHDREFPVYDEMLRLTKARYGPDQPVTLSAMDRVVQRYQAARRLDLALPLFEETLVLRNAKLGPAHADTLQSISDLALGYEAARDRDRALPLWRELVDLWKRKAGAGSRQYNGAVASVGRILLDQHKWSEAEAVFREVLSSREAKEPNEWLTFFTEERLGEALLGQQKYDAAEPLLRAGYEGMKQRVEKIPPQSRQFLTRALDRLIALAEATNKPDDARMWKDEKAKLFAASASTPETAAEAP